jgi:hypothetical protein
MGTHFLRWLFYRTPVGPVLGVLVLLILAGGLVLGGAGWVFD